MLCPAALPRGSVWTLQSWVEAKAGEAAMGKGLIEGVGTFGGDQVKPLAAAGGAGLGLAGLVAGLRSRRRLALGPVQDMPVD